MKRKSIVAFLIILFILIFQLRIFSVSGQELGIVQLREDGYAYKVKEIDVFKVVEYVDNVMNFNNDIYCIKAGPGFGGTITEPTTRLTYTFTYNLKEKSNIPSNYLSSLPSDTDITKQIEVNGESIQVTYTNYNAVLWLLDNIYLPKSENATQKREILLKNAFAEKLNDTSLIPPFTLDQINLTDSDLEVVQQLAIWHFTNAGDSKYDMGESLPAIQISEKNNTANYNGYDMDSYRQDDAQTLYKYLINNAMINANKYGKEDVRELPEPLNLVKNELKLEYTDSNVIVGPFKIEKKSDLPYNLSTQVLDQKGSAVENYSLLKEDSTGNKVNVESGKTIADLVGENFYISVPKGNGVTGIKLKINCGYYKTEALLGVVEGDTNQQPLVKLTDKLITYEQEDSIDYNFDLALRKFITGLNGEETNARVPQVTVDEVTGKITYNHTKDPVITQNGDLVEYTIRIYNEGTVSGYAESIKDDIPEGLEFVEENETNIEYGWVKTGDSITTDYLSRAKNEGNIIPAFDRESMSEPAYKDVKVVFKVIEPNISNRTLINTAEINEDSDENGEEIEDIDSTPGNGIEGEDDIDKEYVVLRYFDLALRKFITGLNGVSTDTRVPQVTVDGTGKVTYNHTKDPVITTNGDLVEYTIRVYNEGSIAGYAESIKDDIPEGLEFVEENETNIEYGWVKTGNSITTDYLSKAKNEGNIIPAFDRESMSEPAYKDVKVVFRVVEPNTSDRTLINTAEINEDSNEYNTPDIDSIPGNGEDGEDDIDKEYVVLRYFDLALRKFITGLNGEVTDTRVPQVTVDDTGKVTYNHTKDPVITTNGDLVEYTIRVYNEGSIAGYAERIKDDIPEGLEFVEDNETNIEYGWVKTGDNITTDYLSKANSVDNIIPAFDRESMSEPAYKDVKVVFRVVEPNTSDRTLINTAEINEDSNEYDTPDIDSTPGNGLEGEDDIDKEYVVLRYFDLALRKFITGLNGVSTDTRVPQVTVDGTGKVTYNHTKDPVITTNGDLVEYTIRVYNEGSIAGYAESIKDDIPEGLEFVEDNETNIEYGWVKTGNSITTDYLSKVNSVDNIIPAFDRESMSEPAYKDVKVVFRVIEPNTSDRTLINTAEINEDSNEYDTPDIDSTPGNGEEGEDDIDKEYVVLRYFDLALRKFITGLNGVSTDTRVPQVTVDGVTGQITYNHTKDPVITTNGDLVEYTIRVYNEGSIAGYAESIKDDIPEGLEFVEENETNIEYGWVKTGNSITTDYLSKVNSVDNIIPAFDRNTMQEPAYKDVKVVFRVIEPNTSDRTLINTAEINEDSNEYNTPDIDSTPGNGIEGEDDIDKEYVVLRYFDLALRKFITGLNGVSTDTRVPQVTVDGTGKVTYNHTKDPVITTNGDLVEYTIRVYNEGSIAGYAESIKDDIPEGLEFVEDNETNIEYGWVKTGESITTDYLSKAKNEGNIIPAFDRNTMQEPAYKDVKVVFRVIEPNTSDRTLINTAEINEDSNEYNTPDIDSTPGNGIEGEDDIDKEYVVLRYFDLALRKFITGLNGVSTDTRVPQVTVDGTGKVTYNHTKDPVITTNGDLVEYTIRVYNEGSIAGYAESIKDDIPEGLEFVEDNETNIEYGWVKTGNSITTDYLSKANSVDNIIPAFDRESMSEPAYKDVKVVFRVVEPNTSDRTLINTAEINEDSNEYDTPDIDSTPGNGLEGEDDIDKEYVVLRYFDLALRKFITGLNGVSTDTRVPQVTVDGTGKVTYNHTKDPVITTNGDLVEYTIRVYNEGSIAGYAESIKDDIPEGLEFVEDNETNIEYGWVKTGDSITTDYLSKAKNEDNIIPAFDRESMSEPAYKDVKVVFRVIEPNTSDRTLINTAEINEDSNEYDTPDIDSTPGNGIEGEDDIDKEYVVLRYFDLALRKFITGLNGVSTDTRVPQVTVDDTGKVTYNHTKDPVITTNGDLVEYTIRVYNEGSIAGYAESIKDDIPEGLEFVEDNEINIEYGWVKTGDSITTDYLSKANSVDNIIPAFDRNTMQEPAYKDVKVVFRVIEPNTSDRTLINTAEINEDSNEYDTPDIDSTPGNGIEGEDDIDKEYVVLRYFDLALRKFITGLNGEETNARVPQVTVDGVTGQITYNHTKDPVITTNGDLVEYTIRVYNEGSIAGYAESIKDDIPEGLEFVEDNETNIEYGWVKTGNSITTDYLSKVNSVDNIIPAFDRESMSEPAYKDVKVVFRVVEPNTSDRTLINTAEINEDSNEYNTPDIDSTPGNGIEGEDDIDKEYVVLRYFDLALRKFITGLNGEETDTRVPQVTVDDTGKITYNHTKDPVITTNGDLVEYTIRVYNEGSIAGYAESIKDDIPEGLEFVEDNETNIEYGWVKTGESITTDYLSKAKNVDNIIPGFDRDTMKEPAYKDVKVAFRVTEEMLPSDRILINTAEINDDSNEYDTPDIDSTPGNGIEGEDDIDKEYVRVQYFDLSLLKWVSKVFITENGVTTEQDTGHTGLEQPEPVVKVDLDRKNLNNITVKFEYTIKITNEGQIAGYAKEISDYIPEGLEFMQEDNPNWTVSGDKIVTRELENTLLQPGETAEVKVILTWKNDPDNMGVKINIAEISEDYNDKGAHDIDSTPNNQVEGEDDIDDAPVALSIKTGQNRIYFTLIGIVLITIAGGIVLIKRNIL